MRECFQHNAAARIMQAGKDECMGFVLNFEQLLLRKVGFQEEGVLREWGFWKGGFRDVRCFSLLRNDLGLAARDLSK